MPDGMLMLMLKFTLMLKLKLRFQARHLGLLLGCSMRRRLMPPALTCLLPRLSCPPPPPHPHLLLSLNEASTSSRSSDRTLGAAAARPLK